MPLVMCVICEGEFNKTPSHIAASPLHLCSPKCRTEYKRLKKLGLLEAPKPEEPPRYDPAQVDVISTMCEEINDHRYLGQRNRRNYEVAPKTWQDMYYDGTLL